MIFQTFDDTIAYVNLCANQMNSTKDLEKYNFRDVLGLLNNKYCTILCYNLLRDKLWL